MATLLANKDPDVASSAVTSDHDSRLHYPPAPSQESHEMMAADELPLQESVQTEYPTGAKLWLILINVAAVLVLACIDMNILPTALPRITNYFHTISDAGWYSSAFRLCLCAFQFVFGKAYVLFSVKRVFLLANVISMAGSVLSGAATTSTMLIAGRAIAGLGSAGLFSGCFIILVQSIPLHRRPLYVGIMGGVQGVAACAAPLLGGAITQSLSWRWCFYLTAPIGALTLLCTVFCFPDAPKPADVAQMGLWRKVEQLDLLSNLLFIPSLTCLFLALSWAGTKYAWSDARVVGTLVTFGVLLAAFVYHQIRRGREATLPPHVMRHRSVVAGAIFIVCMNSADSILDYYLPTYYQVVRHYTPAKSGYMMLPIIAGAIVGSLLHGAGTSAFGYYAPFMLIASILMPVALGLTTTFSATTNFAQLVLYGALFGLAYGIGFSGPQNAVQTSLSPEDVPLGLSAILFAQSFGPAVAVTVAQLVFSRELKSSLDRLGLSGNETAISQKGLLEIFHDMPLDRVEQALLGFNKSLERVWYIAVGLACMTLVGTLLMEWKSVKAKKD